MTRSVRLLTLVCVLLARTVSAGQNPTPVAAAAPVAQSSIAIVGPPPPVAPATISRDSAGRATLRATRLTAPLRIDGVLDEPVYETVRSMSDFIQNDPLEGAPATEKTEVWIFFDEHDVYVVARCWESQPDRMISNEMRRDGSGIPSNESFAWSFDTFYDRRNGVFFEMTPIGGRMDAQFSNERTVNNSWNPVWEFKAGRFAQGWVMEARIPFKSLRYRPGTSQVWSFQAKRRDQWKNETSFLGPVPRSFGGAGHFRGISVAPTLVGIEAPSGAKNLEIKPYGISTITSDSNARPKVANDLDGDVGVDLKYGVTQNLTADVTYNTDFAQVEADEQQINLTRFSLFFPEKREFFLENSGTFDFGTRPQTTSNAGSDTDPPTFFYSRRIGLDRAGRSVPIIAGGRLTGRLGGFQVGLLNIQSDDVPAARAESTNFTVLRMKRDLLRKSSIGAIYTGRSISETGVGRNDAFGVDGLFGFFDNLNIATYYAQTSTAGRPQDDASYRGQLDYNGDRYGVILEHLTVGKNFNPEVGFVRRQDMSRNFGSFRFSPRPRKHKYVRKLSWTGSLDYIDDGTGRLETREGIGSFQTDFHNGDKFTLNYTNAYEFLPVPLRLTPNVSVPIGAYDFQNVAVGYTYAPTRKVASGAVAVDHGSFYSGDKTTITLSSGKLVFPPHLIVEPSYSMNKVSLLNGKFTTHLVGSRVNLPITPWMFVGALLQFNSTAHTVSSNVRFRWEYQPGSELFVVYNDQRNTVTRGFPDLANRSFIVKINRLFRF